MEISGLIAKVGIDLTEYERGIAKMQNKMNDAAMQMTNIGKKMSMAITLPLSAIGTATFNTYTNFETLVTKITTLTDVSKAEFEGLEGSIRNIAENTGNSLKEVTEGFYFIASSGFKGAEAINILDKTAKAAANGLGSSVDISQLLTSVLSAYGKENINAAEATDILIRAVKNGKAESSDLAQSLGEVLPIASQMKVSFKEVSAAVSGLTLIGMNTSESVTAIKGVLNEMLNMSEQGKKALLDMGTSYDELYNTLTTQGFLPFLQKIDGLMQQFGERSIGKVFGNVRSLSGVLGLVGERASDVEAIFKDIAAANGDLDKAFLETQQTLQYKWNTAVTGVKILLTELGDGIKGALVPILEGFTKVIKTVTNIFSNMSNGVKTTIVVIAGLTAAAGPMLLVTAKLVSTLKILLPLIPLIKTSFVSLQATVLAGTTGLKGFNLVFAALGNLAKANPFGLILTGVTLLIPAITKLVGKHKELNENIEEESELQKELNEAIKTNTADTLKDKAIINSSIESILRLNEGNSQRKLYIENLIRSYPEYFKNINSEKVTNSELVGILKDVNTEIDKRIKLLTIEAQQKVIVEKNANALLEYNKLLSQRSENEQAILQEASKLMIFGTDINSIIKEVENRTNSLGRSTDESISKYDNIRKLAASYNMLQGKIAIAEGPLEEMNKLLQDIIATQIEEEGTIKNTTNTTKEYSDTTKEVLADNSTEWNAYLSKMQDIYKRLKEGNSELVKSELDNLIEERNNYIEETGNMLSLQLQNINNKKNLTEKDRQEEYNKLVNAYNLEYRTIDEFNKKINKLRKDNVIKVELEPQSFTEAMLLEDKLTQAFIEGKITVEQYQKALADGTYDLNALLDENAKRVARISALNSTFADVTNNLFRSISSGLGDAMNGVKSFSEVIINSVADVVKSLLQMAAAFLIKNLFEKNSALMASMGPAGILALLGLSAMAIAGVSALQSQIQGLAEGGLVKEGGTFMVGERGRELVTLPAGSAVRPMNNISNNIYLDGELSTRVRGEDLEFVLNKVSFKNRKR